MMSSATSRNAHSMMTCELNYVAIDPIRGQVPLGKDTMHQILLRKNIPTLMTVKEKKSTLTHDITIRLGQEGRPITSTIEPKKKTATGVPMNSISSEGTSKRSFELGEIMESMTVQETATNGGPTTTTTRSIVSMSRSSTGSRKSSSGHRKRHMRTEGNNTREEITKLRMLCGVPVSAFSGFLASPSSCLGCSPKTINMLRILLRKEEAP